MIAFPQLQRLKIKTIYNEIEVQMILIRPKKYAKLLVFDHSVSRKALEKFQVCDLANHLLGLVYELPYPIGTIAPIESVENQLKNKKGKYEVGIFHEPSTNFDELFIIVHRDYSQQFGVVFKGAKLAVFQLSYRKLFGSKSELFNLYLNEMSRANFSLRNLKLSYILEFNQLQSEIESLDSKIKTASEKNREDQKKIETVKKLMRKLSLDIQCTSDKHFLDCENCGLERKNVVFLPCGDIIHCKNCIISHIKIPLNTRLKISLFKCQRCRNTINEAREVFY